MGADEKMQAKWQEAKGEAKQGVGGVTGDRDLEAEGKKDETKGGLKQAGEKVKDAADKAKDAFK